MKQDVAASKGLASDMVRSIWATNSRNRHAVIIGGSMSGLFTAAFLRQIGWHTDVYERSTVELVGRGAGITTHPELLEALAKSGAGTRDLGVQVEKRITLNRDGRVIGEKYLPQILTSWDRLQRLLRETIDKAHYHLGHTFERVVQDSSGVVVHFAGGQSERADLLIGADGIRSGVRAQVAPTVQPIYSGYYIWRGAPNEADLKPETRASIFPYFTFFLPEQQQVLGYPIAGLNNELRPGHRRYNFIWYRIGDAQELHRMCLDENGRQHEYSVPPPLIRKNLIAQMRTEAEEIMPPQFLDCLNKMQPFFTPIYDFTTPQLVFERVALVGDAAASARPHMGFGMAKAGSDAQALAEALASHDDIDDGLAAYNGIRQPIGERIVLHGRKLGTYLGVNLKTDEDRATWKLLQDYHAMMDRIAEPGFLAAY
ncbi:MAG TPA: FAD binding domain-containing protein [Acetobacteraceae bacterium]|nr:FAD binding domain-containing protein [Acetobacteraceae bacterium]